MSDPKRVFILGLQRSGTTWLANMLAALPEIAAIEDARHNGVHESLFFSHFARAFGPWHDLPSRQRFLEAFKASDYYRLSDLEPELLDEFRDTKDDYAEVFLATMDLFALVNGAEAWIEKSPHHTFCADEILQAVPDARFLMIERRVRDLVLSRLHGFGRKPPWGPRRWMAVARGAFAATLARREMRRLSRRENALLLSYEALRDDESLALRRRILAHIGVAADPAAMQSRYAANSSFDTAKRRRLGPVSSLVLTLSAGVAALLPLRVLRHLRARRLRRRGIDWPDWAWTQSGFDPRRAERPGPDLILD